MLSKEMWETLPKYAQFSYWFIRHDGDIWEIYAKKDNIVGELVGTYDECTGIIKEAEGIALTSDMPSAIVEDFNQFKLRPEYQVGKSVNMEQLNMEEAVTLYETLLTGIILIRANRSGAADPDSAFNKFKQICLNWLRTTDMYTAPGSTRFHDSFAGGLLYHSLKVYNKAMELTALPTFATQSNILVDSVALVALTHDWCKIDLYEPYMRNVKNDQTGKWEQVQEYKKNQRGVSLGHGVSSMFLASKCFKLTVQESIAIRWHMGFCRVADADMDELQMSNEMYPLVHLLQFADQLAIVNY